MSESRNVHRAPYAARPRFLRVPAIMTFAVGLVFASLTGQLVAADDHWVGTWATSPQATNDISFNNQTLRMIVRTSIGGKKGRVRVLNAYGTVPLGFGAAPNALRSPGTVGNPGY